MRELRHAEIVLIRGDGNAKIAACGNRVGSRMRQHGDSGGRWQAKNKKELPQNCGSSENSHIIKPTHAPMRRKSPSMHMS